MGFMDIFKAKENERLKLEVSNLKLEIESLNLEIEKLRCLVTPEHLEAESLEDKILTLNKELTQINHDTMNSRKELNNIELSIIRSKEKLVQLDEEVLLQEFGLYKPVYNFANSYEYKNELDRVRRLQKEMIKNKTATNSVEWKVDGDVAKGRKMTNDNIKQILRTFNVECENAIDKVTFSNIESMRKRINNSFDSLNKMNESKQLSLRTEYLDLKFNELNLAYEYEEKKQLEKEEQKEIRARMKEEAELQKELEMERKNLNKDIKHFNNALESMDQQLKSNALDENTRLAIEEKKQEVLLKVVELNGNLENVDYRQNNQRAGYVYVISNIGSFGENRYKIGMTRRLNPMDRIDELGNASVPFNFDVHALIFTEDAPKLESALHRAFENKKVNMINKRREFFEVKLEEIEEVVKNNFDKSVEFTKTAKAEQYRETLKLKESMLVS